MAYIMKKILPFAVLCLALCLLFCACGDNGDKDPTQGSTVQKSYELVIASEGGSPMADITVYIYADDTLADLVAFAKTDKNGKASFTYNEGSYVAVLTGVPEGYKLEKCYPVTETVTNILLPVELVQGDVDTATYKLGDIMKNFSFTACDGTQYQLAQLLQEKKAVVLNFFFMGCGPCRQEFPHLQAAYEAYAEDIIVLAMDPVDTDNNAIAAFAEELGLTFPVGSCESGWEKAMKIMGYPTTVVVDRFGTVSLIHTGSIPDTKVFEGVFAFFTAEDYTQTTVTSVEELITENGEETGENVLLEVSGVSSFTFTLAPGKTQEANIHKMTNVWMQYKSTDISVEYGGKVYHPSNGTVGLMVSAPSTFDPARVIFTNNGTKEQTVTVTLSSLAGTYANPYTMRLGQFSTKIAAGNNQGVYFTYTAPEDGQFKLQCLKIEPNVAYDFSIMNLTTSAVRNLSTDSTVDENGRDSVVMPMNSGEKLRITISALPDDTNNYPAASFTMLASFTAGDVEDVVVTERIPYAVTITDENRNPIPGVNVTLTGTEDNKTTLSTDEKGQIAVYLEKDTYTGSVLVPSGYKAVTQTFLLTEQLPMISLKLDTYIVEYADYAVRVVDEEGNGVEGVLITIGTTYGTTDADGAYTVNLAADDYTVTIGVPQGYTADTLTYMLPKGTTVLGITLRQSQQGQEPVGIDYTVTVKDASGAAMQNVLVTFYQNGAPAGMVPVNENGVATATLPAGDYTVTLTSANGTVLGHSAEQAALSAEKTETTIYVAKTFGENYQTAWWGNYYVVTDGSYQAKTEDAVNFSEDLGVYMFVFTPATSGIYRFEVSDGAVLGYYGGINFPNGPSKSTETDGYFELIVRDGEFANDNQPSSVMGVQFASGAVQAIVTVTRTDDAPAELPVIIYEPKQTPTAFTFRESGTLTYVDIESNATIQKGDDGFYYLDGKKLYINLSNEAPFITFSNMLGLTYNAGQWTEASTGTGMKGYLYEGETVVAVEDYTQCMRDYICASDPVSGLYPLTEDLVYMIQSCGDYLNWWNAESYNYLFTSKPNLNTELAWAFAVCYVQ